MDESQQKELTQKLDVLIALSLCHLERRTEPADVIAVLTRFKVPPRDIAAMLGMTPNAVRVARHRMGRSRQHTTQRSAKA